MLPLYYTYLQVNKFDTGFKKSILLKINEFLNNPDFNEEECDLLNEYKNKISN
jgi:hypothetical protein